MFLVCVSAYVESGSFICEQAKYKVDGVERGWAGSSYNGRMKKAVLDALHWNREEKSQ